MREVLIFLRYGVLVTWFQQSKQAPPLLSWRRGFQEKPIQRTWKIARYRRTSSMKHRCRRRQSNVRYATTLQQFCIRLDVIILSKTLNTPDKVFCNEEGFYMSVAPVLSSISKPDLFFLSPARLEYLFGALLWQQHEYMMQKSEKRAKTTPSTIAAIRIPSILL